MKIKFFGAARQVTGSCYYLEANDLRILVDCGLFQERDYVGRNWAPLPVDPARLDYIILTHSHLDHAGLLPKVVRDGFSGRVLATTATVDLLEIVLLDAAKIQEEDAAYKRKRHKKEGREGPYPEKPLYTVEDAKKCLPLVTGVEYGNPFRLNGEVSVTFHDAGHILGAAQIEIKLQYKGRRRRLVFSGDLGQWDKPLVEDPEVFDQADYIVLESTYGDRIHDDPEDVEVLLRRIINETIQAGGNVVIPTFAIERAQELMFYLSRLVRENKIPFVKIFLDSPMAVDVTGVFQKYHQYLDEETRMLFRNGEPPFRFPGLSLVRSSAESKSINALKEPVIIMAGSGMCTGGRIKHHLVRNIERPESTLLFVGFQAKGTLGRYIISGEKNVRILGRYFSVKARIEQIYGFSAHADRDDLLRWLGSFQSPPRRLFLTHGEEESALSLSKTVRKKMGWNVIVPKYKDEVELD